jgi:DNA-directed RNA polymerase specialized sigma24 family protein
LTEELLEEAETAARVREAISTLPPGQSEAVRLFYLDSLSEAEVAAELGIARSAVKSRLDKARRSLVTYEKKEEPPWPNRPWSMSTWSTCEENRLSPPVPPGRIW